MTKTKQTNGTGFSKRKAKMQIQTAEQWKGINSPVRLQIFAFFESAGPMSIAELAQLMDFRPDGLYHHIKLMIKGGLVREVGFRKTERQIETVYDLTAEKFEFKLDSPKGSGQINHLTKLHQIILRNADRVLVAAIDGGTAKIKGPDRNFYSRYETAWLNKQEMSQVSEHIEAITEIFRNARRSNDGVLMMANCNLAPINRKRGHAEK